MFYVSRRLGCSVGWKSCIIVATWLFMNLQRWVLRDFLYQRCVTGGSSKAFSFFGVSELFKMTDLSCLRYFAFQWIVWGLHWSFDGRS